MSSPSLEMLQADIKAAMKAQEKDKVTALRTLHSEIKNLTVNAGVEESDELVARAVAKAIKQRSDSVEQYRKGGREDLAAREQAEIELFRKYQPRQMERAEIEAIARQCIAEAAACGKQDVGKVMQALMPKVKGKADGRLVSQVVGELLG